MFIKVSDTTPQKEVLIETEKIVRINMYTESSGKYAITLPNTVVFVNYVDYQKILAAIGVTEN